MHQATCFLFLGGESEGGVGGVRVWWVGWGWGWVGRGWRWVGVRVGWGGSVVGGSGIWLGGTHVTGVLVTPNVNV